MKYMNTSCFWPLSAKFKTVFTTALFDFFSFPGLSISENLEICFAGITLCESTAAL